MRWVSPWLGGAIVALAGALRPARADAALFAGALPNAVRYAVLPSPATPGHVSLRLIVQAGSADESANEKGYAHFVEHMAFNGTRHFAAGALFLKFQRMGLSFGADANANTSYTRTIYRIDLADGRGPELAEALAILRDWADGQEFPEREVDRERGVVRSEMLASDIEQHRWEDQRIQILYANTVWAAHPPLGEERAVRRASSARLRAFYRRTYRPDRIIVAAAGDVNPEGFASEVRRQFGDIPSGGPVGRQAYSESSLHQPKESPDANEKFHPLKSTAGSGLQFAAVLPPAPDPETDAGRQVAMVALNRRLASAHDQRDVGLERMDAFSTPSIDGRWSESIMEARENFNLSAWAPAVVDLAQALKAATAAGFSAAELAEAASVVRTKNREESEVFAARPAATVADELAETLARDAPWIAPDERAARISAALSSPLPDGGRPAIAALFPLQRLQVLLLQAHPPRAAELAATFRSAWDAPVPPAPAQTERPLQFFYGPGGEPGTVGRVATLADLALSELEFANGVQINLRRSATLPGRFLLRARIGAGLADMPPDAPGFAFLASEWLRLCGLKRNSRSEIERLLALKGVIASVGFAYRQGELVMDLSGPAGELPFALTLIAARLSDWQLDPARLAEAQWDHHLDYAVLTQHSAASRATEDLFGLLTGSDPRASPVPLAGPPSAAALSEWIDRHWLRGPLEIGLTGDFAAADAIAAAAATVGTLPRRRAAPALNDGRLALRSRPVQSVTHLPLPDGASTVALAWPVLDGDRPASSAASVLASDVLTDRIRAKLRQDLGATYSPAGGMEHDPTQPGLDYILLTITGSPGQIGQLAEIASQLAAELARHGVRPEEFDRLLAPRLARARARYASDSAWVTDVLCRAQSTPGAVTEMINLVAGFRALNSAEVSRAASTLTPNRLHLQLVLP